MVYFLSKDPKDLKDTYKFLTEKSSRGFKLELTDEVKCEEMQWIYRAQTYCTCIYCTCMFFVLLVLTCQFIMQHCTLHGCFNIK